MLEPERYIMPEAPTECLNDERRTMSPSRASRCELKQENDEEICLACPKWLPNVVYLGFIEGYNSVTQEEVDAFHQSLIDAGILPEGDELE